MKEGVKLEPLRHFPKFFKAIHRNQTTIENSNLRSMYVF